MGHLRAVGDDQPMALPLKLAADSLLGFGTGGAVKSTQDAREVAVASGRHRQDELRRAFAELDLFELLQIVPGEQASASLTYLRRPDVVIFTNMSRRITNPPTKKRSSAKYRVTTDLRGPRLASD